MPLLSSVKVQRLSEFRFSFSLLLRYACSILYFYFFFLFALHFFPDAISIILRKKYAASLSITGWKGVKSWRCISDIALGRPDADASAAPLIKPAHVHLWEVAAFWLCHLPHQHHFQAPAMHLSVAEGVRREQAQEGHGAAPASRSDQECRECPLCREHPAQSQG